MKPIKRLTKLDRACLAAMARFGGTRLHKDRRYNTWMVIMPARKGPPVYVWHKTVARLAEAGLIEPSPGQVASWVNVYEITEAGRKALGEKYAAVCEREDAPAAGGEVQRGDVQPGAGAGAVEVRAVPGGEPAVHGEVQRAAIEAAGLVPGHVLSRSDRLVLRPNVPVVVRHDDGTEKRHVTRSEPWKLGGHTWVISLTGIVGGYALDRLVRVAEPSGA